MKGTKTPWKLQLDGGWSIVSGNKTICSDNMDFSEQHPEESEANGRLIVQAVNDHAAHKREIEELSALVAQLRTAAEMALLYLDDDYMGNVDDLYYTLNQAVKVIF